LTIRERKIRDKIEKLNVTIFAASGFLMSISQYGAYIGISNI